MLEADVIKELGRYGGWLEEREAVELRPRTLDPGSEQIGPVSPEHLVRRRPRWILAAAAVALVGLIGAGWVAGRSGSSSSETLATDPTGPLFVLPQEGSEFTIESASVATDLPPTLFAEIVIFGEITDGVIGDLSSARATRQLPKLAPRDSWVEIETSIGPAQRSTAEIWTVLARQSGDWWVVVQTGAGRLDEAVTVLEGIGVTAEGAIEVGPELTDRLIERVSMDPEQVITSTFAEVAQGVGAATFAVETATAPSPLIPAGSFEGEIRETTVRGLPAWHLSRIDADGEWNGLTWLASPNRIVAVSGTASIDQVRLLAESLRPVDEDTWRQQTGNQTD